MAGPILTNGNVTSDWLLFESTDIGRYSRQNVTIAASQTLKDGQVIGVDGSGNIMEYDNEVVTNAGGAVAVGILIGDVTTGVGETKKGVIVARFARVASSKLIYKSGASGGDKTAALADLATLGIHTVVSV